MVDVLAEHGLADGDGHDGLGDGQGGQRQLEDAGVEGALHEERGDQAHGGQGVGGPEREEMDPAAVQQVAGAFREGGGQAKGDTGGAGERDGPDPARRVLADEGQRAHRHAHHGEQGAPLGRGRPRPARARAGRGQEHGEPGHDGGGAGPVDGAQPALGQQGAEREGEEQAGHEQRGHQGERAPPQGEELEGEAQPVEAVAGVEPPVAPQAQEHARAQGVLVRHAHRGPVLENGREGEAEGGTQGEGDDRQRQVQVMHPGEGPAPQRAGRGRRAQGAAPETAGWTGTSSSSSTATASAGSAPRASVTISCWLSCL